MTFKFDSFIVADTPVKIMDLPDHVWVGLQAPADNTAGIFVANSSLNVSTGTKRAKLDPGVGLPFLATGDDALWVMAEDNSEPELIVLCADEIGSITGTLGSGIVPAAPVAPDIAGHWGNKNSSTVSSFQITGISVNANNKYYIAIANEDNGQVSSVTGMGLTWVWEEEAHNSGQCRLTIYRGDGTPSGTGTVTVNQSSSPSYAAMVVAVAGANNASPTIDDDPKTGNGSSVTSVACNTEADGLFLGFLAEDNNRTFTPTGGSDFVTKYGVSTDIAVHLVKFLPTTAGTRSFSGTMSGSADWASITMGIRKA